jgi:glutathione S-transferase
VTVPKVLGRTSSINVRKVLWTLDELDLADVVLGLSTHRWLHSPIQRLEWPALTAYYARLKQRPAFAAWSLPQVP